MHKYTCLSFKSHEQKKGRWRSLKCICFILQLINCNLIVIVCTLEKKNPELNQNILGAEFFYLSGRCSGNLLISDKSLHVEVSLVNHSSH